MDEAISYETGKETPAFQAGEELPPARMGAGNSSDTEVATGLVRSTLFASPFCHCPLRESVFDRNAQTVPLRQACACSGELLPHIPFATDTGETGN